MKGLVMETQSRAVAPNIVLGLGIIGLGLALLLDRIGWLSARDLLQYWPVLLIVFGASVVWQAWRGNADGSGPGRPIVSPGLVLLLIVIGVIATRSDWRRANQAITTPSETVGVTGVLGQGRQTSTASHFRGAEMTAIMGGSSLDLRQSHIPDGEEAVVEVFSLMGGIDIFVPPHWQVVPEVVPIMGGVEDRRVRDAVDQNRRQRTEARDREPAADTTPAAQPGAPDTPALEPVAPQPAVTTDNPPRLIIRGFMMMSGLDIRR